MKRHMWKSGSFWYFHAVSVSKGMHNFLFNGHIQPLFNKEHSKLSIFDKAFFWYWGGNVTETIRTKLKDEEEYLKRVTEAFGFQMEPFQSPSSTCPDASRTKASMKCFDTSVVAGNIQHKVFSCSSISQRIHLVITILSM